MKNPTKNIGGKGRNMEIQRSQKKKRKTKSLCKSLKRKFLSEWNNQRLTKKAGTALQVMNPVRTKKSLTLRNFLKREAAPLISKAKLILSLLVFQEIGTCKWRMIKLWPLFQHHAGTFRWKLKKMALSMQFKKLNSMA